MAHALRKVLKIDEASVYDVLGRMHTLGRHFEITKRLRLHRAFLQTYALVTQEVALRSARGEFARAKALERLDVAFAKLYFTPLYSYLSKREMKTPWQGYLRYTQKGSSSFVALLLGINAHINADLCTSLIDLDYRERQDFLKINKILSALIPRIMSDLVFDDHDLLGLGGMVFKRLTHTEFRKIIVVWRNDAWENAQKIRRDPSLRKKLHSLTEQNACDIIDAFSYVLTPGTMLKALHKCRVRL